MNGSDATPNAEQHPTDREMWAALFDLIGALAERLTGERPVVKLTVGENEFVSVVPAGGHVTWIKTEKPTPLAERLLRKP